MFHDYFVFREDRGTGDGMCAAHLINMACAKVMHTTVAVHLTGRCVSVRHILHEEASSIITSRRRTSLLILLSQPQ